MTLELHKSVSCDVTAQASVLLNLDKSEDDSAESKDTNPIMWKLWRTVFADLTESAGLPAAQSLSWLRTGWWHNTTHSCLECYSEDRNREGGDLS